MAPQNALLEAKASNLENGAIIETVAGSDVATVSYTVLSTHNPAHITSTLTTHENETTGIHLESSILIPAHTCTSTPTLHLSSPPHTIKGTPTPALAITHASTSTLTYTCLRDSTKPQNAVSQEEIPVPDEEDLLMGDKDKFLPSSSYSCHHHAVTPDVDGGWAWVVFAAGFLQFFISSAMYYSFSVYYVELVQAFGQPRAKTCWVYSTNSAIHMFCGPLGGWAISRWGPRATVMMGGFLACLGYVGSAFSPSLNIIFFTYGVVNGVGTSLNFSGWVVGLGRFWERRRSWVTGMAMAGSGVGVAVLGPMVSVVVQHYGWRGAMLISAGLSLNFCVLGATIFSGNIPNLHHSHCILAKAEAERGHKNNVAIDRDTISPILPSLATTGSRMSLEQSKKSQWTKSASEVAMWPGFWLLQASCFLSFLATTTIFAVLLDWVEWAGLGTAFSAGLAGSGAGDVGGRVLAGLVSGRGPPLLLFSGMQLFLAAVVAGAALATTPLQLVAALVGVGVACGLQSVLHALLPSQLSSGVGVGHVLGWQLVVAGLGALVGPPLAGFIVDLTHSYIPAIALCTAAPAAASLLSLSAHCFIPPQPRHTKPGK